MSITDIVLIVLAGLAVLLILILIIVISVNAKKRQNSMTVDELKEHDALVKEAALAVASEDKGNMPVEVLQPLYDKVIEYIKTIRGVKKEGSTYSIASYSLCQVSMERNGVKVVAYLYQKNKESILTAPISYFVKTEEQLDKAYFVISQSLEAIKGL